jgi:predicted transport protein
MGNFTGTMNPVADNLLLKRTPDFEPKKLIDFVENRNQRHVILPKKRLRNNILKNHVDARFKKNYVDQSTNEKTRKIILESEELAEKKSYKFLKEMNKCFDQLSKNEILEITSQIKLLTSNNWTYFCYKKDFISIAPKNRKIYLRSKKREMGPGSRVFIIKDIGKKKLK